MCVLGNISNLFFILKYKNERFINRRINSVV